MIMAHEMQCKVKCLTLGKWDLGSWPYHMVANLGIVIQSFLLLFCFFVCLLGSSYLLVLNLEY